MSVVYPVMPYILSYSRGSEKWSYQYTLTFAQRYGKHKNYYKTCCCKQ